MSIIKEFKEFFLRDVKTTTGSKPDQEVGFPVTYVVDGVQRNNRFLKNHVPSEAVYKKLFESITFKLNVEDTASTTIQGLVKVATDQNAFDRASEALGAMRSVIEPHQLTDVKNQVITAQTITGDITINNPTVINISDADIVKFVIGATVTGTGVQTGTTISSIDYTANEIELSLNCTATTVGVVLTQVASDTTFNNITFKGLTIGTFKRTISTKFRKIYYTALAFQHSLVIDKATQRLQLDGDDTSPGNNKYYGTNGAGVKGWQNGAYINETYTTVTGNANTTSGNTSILCSYTATGTNTLAINYSGRMFNPSPNEQLIGSIFLKKNGATIYQIGESKPAVAAFQNNTFVADFMTIDVVATDIITVEITNSGSDDITTDGKLIYKKIA